MFYFSLRTFSGRIEMVPWADSCPHVWCRPCKQPQLRAVVCQSSTGNGKSIKQREKGESRLVLRGTGYPTQLYSSLFCWLLKWSRKPYLNFLYSSSLLLKCHTEVRSEGQLQASVLLWLSDGFFASHIEYCCDLYLSCGVTIKMNLLLAAYMANNMDGPS